MFPSVAFQGLDEENLVKVAREQQKSKEEEKKDKKDEKKKKKKPGDDRPLVKHKYTNAEGEEIEELVGK